MSLRLKTVLALAATTAICMAAVSLLLRWHLQSSYDLIERQQAQAKIERCEAALRSELQHLALMVGDWAIWDDTYVYMSDRNKAYVESNLVAASLAHSHIDGIYYFDNSRN